MVNPKQLPDHKLLIDRMSYPIKPEAEKITEMKILDENLAE